MQEALVAATRASGNTYPGKRNQIVATVRVQQAAVHCNSPAQLLASRRALLPLARHRSHWKSLINTLPAIETAALTSSVVPHTHLTDRLHSPGQPIYLNATRLPGSATELSTRVPAKTGDVMYGMHSESSTRECSVSVCWDYYCPVLRPPAPCIGPMGEAFYSPRYRTVPKEHIQGRLGQSCRETQELLSSLTQLNIQNTLSMPVGILAGIQGDPVSTKSITSITNQPE